MKDIGKVKIIYFDSIENYKLAKTQRQLGNGKVYSDVLHVQDEASFNAAIESLNESDEFAICCHVAFEDFSVYEDFINLNLTEKFNFKLRDVNFLSKGDSSTIVGQIDSQYHEKVTVYLYSDFRKAISHDEVTTFKKNKNTLIKNSEDLISVFSLKNIDSSEMQVIQKYPQIDIAIITALYKDEFEAIKKVIDFNEKDIIRTNKKEYHVGYLKSKNEIKVVAAIQDTTGMIDASIVATQMLEFFRPKYLLMSGVCGGKKGSSFGDLIIAQQIYTFQKGKLSDLNSTKKGSKFTELEFYNQKQEKVDLKKIYDKAGNQINIQVEKFEVEHDAVINLDSLIKDKIERNIENFKDNITKFLNQEITPLRNSVEVGLEKMACSSMVVNKDGYFEYAIKPIDRKISAVEMESYGIARACQFANDGKTIPIIFKAVMDNMRDKNDVAKKFAANVSAQFLNLLLESDILT